MDRILESVDRILQGSLGQSRVRRTCRPGSRRRAAGRKQAAKCSFPKELNRPSRTISHHRARAGENPTDHRNQPRVASEKEAQHRWRSSWTPRQARRAPERARQISLHNRTKQQWERTRCPSHMETLGGLAQTAAALVASAPTSSSGVGRLGDGGRSATGRRSEAMCIEESVPVIIGVGRSLCRAREPRRPGLRVQKARERRQVAAGRLKQRGRPSPWGTRVVSHHGQPRRVRRAGEATRS